MKFITKEDELYGFAPTSFPFWRNLALYFCIWSVVGHWIEIGYCSFMNIFGIVEADSLVWDDPFYPFLVYGIGATIFVVLFVPIKNVLVANNKTLFRAVVGFFAIAFFTTMFIEIAMGLMLNQPNAAGEYPLWDNSELPGNILNQAWIVNDFGFAALATLYTWVIYPVSQKLLGKLPLRVMNMVAFLGVAGFIALCIAKFS